jgi:AraC-like DNA-binding protein
MNWRTASTTPGVLRDFVSRPRNALIPNRIPAFAERRRYNKYRELTRKHLSKLFDKLFTEFTGLHFHVAWTPASPGQWDGWALPTACSVCCRLSGSLRSEICRTCGPRQLARALKADGDGHHFTCRLGVRNYWVPIQLRGETFGLAYLQALEHSLKEPPASKRSARSPRSYSGGEDARVMGNLKFARAARLLQLIVQHLQTSSLADLQKEELGNVQRVLRVFESVQKRLRKKLNGLMPAIRKTPPGTQLESRRERIVHAVLDRIQRDYMQPLTLRQCAGDLRVNAAYLSHIFSHAVGLSFKTCLTEVRLEKARELLSDPAENISQVAKAVGYASQNRFRLAFKSVTGLSPRIWRETLRMNPPPSA